ncbi:ABC transporter substrate-binding protein [Nocardia sp. alder85J]|uniref:ABC transporter substrate-binding protein n=1 Tax=Nocardia sp. alder85J TaxID=2862949 RepID=UPI001CD5F796|nr:ABC transporter substrate-binding protein [Nocardia sp. alder85J]MCX4094083.1 ABC transporter substrate-binding protein [Nocardia sp. alder85J]
MRRCLAALAAVATVALAGCSTGSTTGSSDQQVIPELDPAQQVSITFESYNLLQAGVWTDTVKGLVADFEAAHPNIHVHAQPTQGASVVGTNTAGSVQTQLLAGNPPDVAQLTFDSLDFAVTKLGAQPLDKLVGKEAVTEHFGGRYPFSPNAATLADWNGGTYGLPYVFSTPVLFYNASLTAQAGLGDNPDLSTWDKVKAAAQAVTAKTGKPSLSIGCTPGGNWCLQGMMRSNGGRVLSADRTTIQFGEEPAVGTVAMMRDLYDSGVLANLDSSSQYEQFARGGSLAFELQTSALQGTFMSGAKAGNWTLKDAPMPAFTGKPAIPTNSGSALFLFAKDPAKQRAAWEFMKFMTSPHAYEQITTKIGYLPLRPSMTEGAGPLAAWAAGNPLVRPNLEQLSRLEPWVSFPGDSYTQIDTILDKATQDSVFFGKDPHATLADAQRRAQDLVNK